MSFDKIEKILKERRQDVSLNAWGKALHSLKNLCKRECSDYLFEFASFFSLACEIVDVNTSVSWQINSPKVSGADTAKLVWPLAPGHSDFYSYLSANINGRAVVIRPGVQANVPGHNTTIAPDISLRLWAPNSLHDQIVCMWDAKHRFNPEERITRSEIYTFAVEARSLINGANVKWWVDICAESTHKRARLLRNSSILTNGRQSTEPESILIANNVMEAYRYDTSDEAYRGANA